MQQKSFGYLDRFNESNKWSIISPAMVLDDIPHHHPDNPTWRQSTVEPPRGFTGGVIHLKDIFHTTDEIARDIAMGRVPIECIQ